MVSRNYTRKPSYKVSLNLFKIAAIKVGPYQQEEEYSCAVATLRAVLMYWGDKVPEKVLGVLMRVKKKNGAETTQIVNAAQKLGYRAFEKSFTMEQAKQITDKGVPIICDIQSFTKPGSGHYVILKGMSNGDVHLMDPNVEGNQRVLSSREFQERWWDRRMKPPHNFMIRWGIVVLPPSR